MKILTKILIVLTLITYYNAVNDFSIIAKHYQFINKNMSICESGCQLTPYYLPKKSQNCHKYYHEFEDYCIHNNLKKFEKGFNEFLKDFENTFYFTENKYYYKSPDLDLKFIYLFSIIFSMIYIFLHFRIILILEDPIRTVFFIIVQFFLIAFRKLVFNFLNFYQNNFFQ